MKILNLVQGSKEWHEVRRKFFTASEAPAMMGESKYKSRSALLHEKATGEIEEVTKQQQRIFDKGHDSEESARTLLESDLQTEFYPATGTLEVEGLPLLGSFDGLTMMEDIGFEHKLFNESLYQQAVSGELEPHYYWQLEQLLLISGAEKMVFVCSDGTKEKWAQCDYRAVPGRKEALIKGWKQFHQDLVNYVPEAKTEKVIAKTQVTLPVLSIQIAGEVKSSNLALFKDNALSFISSINTTLDCEQDFADAETDIKTCKKAEAALKKAKTEALNQTASISELMSSIEEIESSLRSTRLKLDKLVKTEKERKRNELLTKGKTEFNHHIHHLESSIGLTLQFAQPDFHSAIKGKRNLESIKDAIDTLLAQSKIAANEKAELVRENFALITGENEHLFKDIQYIVNRPHEDFVNLVNARIAEEKDRQLREQMEAAATQKAAEEKLRVPVEASKNNVEPIKAAEPDYMPINEYVFMANWPNQNKRNDPSVNALCIQLEKAEAYIRQLQNKLAA